MHILLALLSGIAGVAWAIFYLHREGFDFTSLNPFLWKRRAHWRRQYEKDPIHTLSGPVEVAALLLLAVAKEAGEISLDEKQKIKALMISELKRSQKEADDLFLASSHLLRECETVVGELANIVANCKHAFSPEQAASLAILLQTVANIGDVPNERQQALITEFNAQFQQEGPKGTWA